MEENLPGCSKVSSWREAGKVGSVASLNLLKAVDFRDFLCWQSCEGVDRCDCYWNTTVQEVGGEMRVEIAIPLILAS